MVEKEFRKHKHVLKLFRTIGAVGNIDVGDKGVVKCFVSKFSNAKTGAKKTGAIKSVSRGEYTRKKIM